MQRDEHLAGLHRFAATLFCWLFCESGTFNSHKLRCCACLWDSYSPVSSCRYASSKQIDRTRSGAGGLPDAGPTARPLTLLAATPTNNYHAPTPPGAAKSTFCRIATQTES